MGRPGVQGGKQCAVFPAIRARMRGETVDES